MHFEYPSRPDVVLNGLNLKINPGERVALVGESGCGKSTIIQLIQRFYDITKGEILIDGIPIHQINLESLRGQMSIVSQEPVLFNDTIRNNIKYGKLSALPEEVEKAAVDANAISFIMGD